MASATQSEDPVGRLTDLVIRILSDERFEGLHRELEGLYEADGVDNSRGTAFRDALYVLIQESGDALGALSDLKPPVAPSFQPEPFGNHS